MEKGREEKEGGKKRVRGERGEMREKGERERREG